MYDKISGNQPKIQVKVKEKRMTTVNVNLFCFSKKKKKNAIGPINEKTLATVIYQSDPVNHSNI